MYLDATTSFQNFGLFNTIGFLIQHEQILSVESLVRKHERCP